MNNPLPATEVILWDNDVRGEFHGGDLIHAALRQAEREGAIRLKAIADWPEFGGYLRDVLGPRITSANDGLREVVFFVHTSENGAAGAFTELVSSRSRGEWERVVRDRHGLVHVLVYSGGEEPDFIRNIAKRGPWVGDVKFWLVKSGPSIFGRVRGLFPGRAAPVSATRFTALDDVPLSLSHLIHDLHNRTAPLRVDLETIEAQGDAAARSGVVAEVLKAAVGDDRSGYLVGPRRGRTLSKFVEGLLGLDGTMTEADVPTLAVRYPSVAIALDEHGRLTNDVRPWCDWPALPGPAPVVGAPSDHAAASRSKDEEARARDAWIEAAKKRFEQLEGLFGAVPGPANAQADPAGAIETLRQVVAWFARLDAYLRALREAAAAPAVEPAVAALGPTAADSPAQGEGR